MVFNYTEPTFDESSFHVCDWSDFYPEAEDAIPHNVPKTRGRGAVTSVFVDADHLGCKTRRHLRTGVFVFA